MENLEVEKDKVIVKNVHFVLLLVQVVQINMNIHYEDKVRKINGFIYVFHLNCVLVIKDMGYEDVEDILNNVILEVVQMVKVVDCRIHYHVIEVS